MKKHNGAIALHLALILLIGSMILSAGVVVYQMWYAVNMSKEKTNEAVLAVAAYNVSVFYGGAREGDGQARTAANANFYAYVATEDVMEQLLKTLPATQTDADTITKDGDGFSMTDMVTTYENYSNGVLNFTTTYTLRIPIRLLSAETTVDIDITTNSSYDPKF